LAGTSVDLIVGWCGRFLFFVVPRQFSPDIGEWPENQILIPDWTYFHCPGATLVSSTVQGTNFGKDAKGETEAEWDNYNLDTS